MHEEQVLNQKIFTALTQYYGLPDSKAAKIARQAVERARRAKHSGPISRPGVLISDKIAEGSGITIKIRKEVLKRHDPHDVLQEYLEKENIPGTWALEEAFGYVNNSVRVWKANKTKVQKRSKASKNQEKDIISDFDKLSSEEQQKILSRLQGKTT